MIRFFSLLLLSSALFAQAPAAATKPIDPTDPAAVPMGETVVLIEGVCDPPVAKTTKTPCETRLTRDQFETMWKTFNRQNAAKPVVEESAANRKAMAAAYSTMAVLSEQARKQGLEKSPEFQLQMKVVRMQLLAKQLQEKIKDENAEPLAAEVDKYYKDNVASYQELSVHRLQIPKRGPQPASLEGKPAAPPVTMTPADAEEYRKRAVAGEDFDKLQKEIVEKLQFKVTPPVTSGKKRHGEFPPQEEGEIFALPQGAVTRVLDEGSSYSIYKIDSKRTLTLDEVRGNISRTLSEQKIKDEENAMSSSATPKFNMVYFSDVGKKDQNAQQEIPLKEPAAKP
jgi:hypothetical protein